MDYKFNTNKNGNCRLCDNKDDIANMICCDDCERWFHLECVGLVALRKKESWSCIKCKGIKDVLTALEKRIKILEAQKSANSSQDPQIQAFEAIVNKINEIQISKQTSSDTFMIRQSLLELPEFDGSYKTWSRFKQTFYETTKQGRFSDLENINRLQKSLKGEALKKVNGLLIDSKNVDTIMTILEDRFGNEKLVYNGFLRDVLALSSPSFENPESMIDFISGISDLVINMECLNHKEYLNDQRLIRDLSNKLPSDLHQSWLRKIGEDKLKSTISNPYVAPTLSDLLEFLKPEEKMAIALLAEQGTNGRKSIRKDGTEAQNCNWNNNSKCLSCGQTHKLYECSKFKEMSTKQRKHFATKHKLCFSCLHANHVERNCRYAKICNIDGCKGNHNRLLHFQRCESGNRRKMKKIITFDSDDDDDDYDDNHNHSSIYYQIIPVTLMNGNKQIETYAFMDSGSSVSLIDSKITKYLEVKGKYEPMELTWTNGNSRKENSMKVELKIMGPNGKSFLLRDLRTAKNLSLPTQSIDAAAIKNQFSYLNDAELQSYKKAVPTILLGLPHANLFKATEEKSRSFNEPIARLTKLGWILFGSYKESFIEIDHALMIKEIRNTNRSKRENVCSHFSDKSIGASQIKRLFHSKFVGTIVSNNKRIKDQKLERKCQQDINVRMHASKERHAEPTVVRMASGKFSSSVAKRAKLDVVNSNPIFEKECIYLLKGINLFVLLYFTCYLLWIELSWRQTNPIDHSAGIWTTRSHTSYPNVIGNEVYNAESPVEIKGIFNGLRKTDIKPKILLKQKHLIRSCNTNMFDGSISERYRNIIVIMFICTIWFICMICNENVMYFSLDLHSIEKI